MHGVTHQSISKLLEEIGSKPLVSILGALFAIVFPVDGWAVSAVVLLITIDTLTGRWAAFARGEEVRSRYTFYRMRVKLQGYMIFIATAALASVATNGLVADGTMFLRGAIGLVGAVEFFSISENLYDQGWIPFDPRKVPMFKMLVSSIKSRKRKEQPDQTP